MAILNPLPLMNISEAVLQLAAEILQSGIIPPKAARDAAHIAISAVHGIDFLLTWNCAHIANAQIVKKVQSICVQHGFPCPLICTPEELMGTESMIHDPIVDEVGAIREELSAQFNFDIRRIVADAQMRQAASRSRVV